MVTKQKLELTRKIGLLGLSDLRRIAPIGDLGYANGWYYPFGDGSWMNGGLERDITKAASEQGFRLECITNGNRGLDTVYRNKEIGLIYHVDSSD